MRPSRVMCLAILFSLAAVPARAQAAPPTEYQVKAAFLFNFAKFTEWPSGSFPGPNAPFLVCILGKDPFGAVLDETLGGKSVGERTIQVQRPRDAAAARPCQLVFVSRSEDRNLTAIFQTLRGTNALVVGESEGFAESGGAIELSLAQDHIRIAVNLTATERAGLRLSSKLLALARIVRNDPGNGKG